jgi:hypothetical protein
MCIYVCIRYIVFVFVNPEGSVPKVLNPEGSVPRVLIPKVLIPKVLIPKVLILISDAENSMHVISKSFFNFFQTKKDGKEKVQEKACRKESQSFQITL